MRSGSSARRRRARASQRERSQSAAGSQSGRTRGGGWQERRGASGTSASSFSAPQELEQLGRGDPGWPPRYVPAAPRAPTWRSWDLPATTAGLTGSGLGLPPRTPLAEAAWWARRDPAPPRGARTQPRSACVWDCCLEPCAPASYASAPGTVCGSVRLADPGLSVFGEGYRSPHSRVTVSGASGEKATGVLCSLIAAPNL